MRSQRVEDKRAFVGHCSTAMLVIEATYIEFV